MSREEQEAAEKREREHQAFLYYPALGKKAEVKVTRYLTDLGFAVKDISNDISQAGEWSPFDLLAVKGDITVLIDVKLRSWLEMKSNKNRCWFTIKNLVSWEQFPTTAIKAVVFLVSDEARFELVNDIRKMPIEKSKSGTTLYLNFYHCRSLNELLRNRQLGFIT